MREFDAIRSVPLDLPHSIRPCRHGYTFCLGEAIPPHERRGRGLQFYDDTHYTGSIGFMEITPRKDLNVLYINLIGVEEEYHNRRYSSAMVDWTIAAAKALRISRVEMPSAVGLDDESAMKLEHMLANRGFERRGNDWMKRISIELSVTENAQRYRGITSQDLRDRPER